MSRLNWKDFESLGGDRSKNFECLCRAIIRKSYGSLGVIRGLSNQPGVEFHIKIERESPELGGTERWWGWQCKWHERTESNKRLTASAKKDIIDSIEKTKKHLKGLTDWVICTPYTLSKPDQIWIETLSDQFSIHCWSDEDIEGHLNGSASTLRTAFFGDLALTLEEAKKCRDSSVRPILDRWMEPIHQETDAELEIREMLFEPHAWKFLSEEIEFLNEAIKDIEGLHPLDKDEPSKGVVKQAVRDFLFHCKGFKDMAIQILTSIETGNITRIADEISATSTSIPLKIWKILRILRENNLPSALDATNAIHHMSNSLDEFDRARTYLQVKSVAIESGAGGGKTQLSAQLTQQTDRPAGIFLQGKHLRKGQTLNDLAKRILIKKKLPESFALLLESVNALGLRHNRRVPIVIDGLNEAECPRDWKDLISQIEPALEEFQHVLVVYTLRTSNGALGDRQRTHIFHPDVNESLSQMSLPENILKIQMGGFEQNTAKAVMKYFDYFKIDPGHQEPPLSLFSHPLTLRLYCYSINPERDKIVSINGFPSSIYPLFNTLLLKISERTSSRTTAGKSFSKHEINSVINKIGMALWGLEGREIQEVKIDEISGDSAYPWETRLSHILCEEGIFMRDFRSSTDEPCLVPAFDALAGNLIAVSILNANSTKGSLTKWLNNNNHVSKFTDSKAHPLSVDIFESLVANAPSKIYGTQLWECLPECLKLAAIVRMPLVEKRYINKNDINKFKDSIINEPKCLKDSHSKLKMLRSVPDNPFNSTLTDEILRKFPVALRDLCWTESLRPRGYHWDAAVNNHATQDLKDTIDKWDKSHIRTESDRLIALWISWMSTSTSHTIRDLATRALSSYGVHAPTQLFNITISALSINDPYVTESLVASAFATVASLSPTGSHRQEINEYIRLLYENLFAPNAPCQTTHESIRTYATKSVECAVFYSLIKEPEIILKDCFPPFSMNRSLKWRVRKDLYELKNDSPFGMDFLHYSIGRLLPDRGPYRDEFRQRKVIARKISWRILNFGWSPRLFSAIDRDIVSFDRSRNSDNERKIDRYGKKYSNIAYQEMLGLKNDKKSRSEDGYSYRRSGIDPTLTGSISELALAKDGFLLGAEELDNTNWIQNGTIDNWDSISMPISIDSANHWVLLDGNIEEEDRDVDRHSYAQIRSIFVKNEDYERILALLAIQSPEESAIPHGAEFYNIFAGEIPWGSAFTELGVVNMVLTESVRTEMRKFRYVEYKIAPGLAGHLFLATDDIDDSEIHSVEERPVDVREEKTFPVLIPTCCINWEETNPQICPIKTITTLSKCLSTELSLHWVPGGTDLYDSNKVRATKYSESKRKKISQDFFHIRSDLLYAYLETHGLRLIRAVQGEREYSRKTLGRMLNRDLTNITYRKLFFTILQNDFLEMPPTP